MAGNLTDRFVLKVKVPGTYADGSNLYLNVSATLKKGWSFKYRFGGKRREMSLGSYPLKTLVGARRAAFEANAMVKSGVDPLEARNASGRVTGENGRVTFEQFAAQYLEGKRGGFKSAKHFKQWQTTLSTYAQPLHDLSVDEIKTANVLAVLQPIWLKIPETSSRLRGRIEMILNAAQSLGLIPEERPNPARWRGHLSNLLPAQPKSQEHHAALAYKDLPAFIAELRDRRAVAALGLEFAILCGGRTGEIIGAKWSEFDLEEKLWIVPAGRMKAKREHRVPLSTRALEILDELQKARINDFVFIAQLDRPLSNMAMLMLLKRMGRNGEEARKAGRHVTTHGFRSTCRDWAGDCTNFAREIIEQVLAHTIGSKVEAAYRRGDALDKRRVLMQAWASFCEGRLRDNVVQLGS